MIKIDYQDYINLIISQAESIKENYFQTRKTLIVKDMYVSLWYDSDTNEYLNGLQYKRQNELCWTWSNPKEFYEKYCNDKDLIFILYSFRQYGEPKLDKPKELKGIKQTASIDYIPKKCKCPMFILGDDVWIQHNDYFSPSMKVSPEDVGMPLGYLASKYCGKDKKNKFIYPDSWGDIVLRQQAWIKIENLIHRLKIHEFELDIVSEICRQQEKLHGFKENELCTTNMERFWEKVVKESKKYI
jgi:hypothetical protein